LKKSKFFYKSIAIGLMLFKEFTRVALFISIFTAFSALGENPAYTILSILGEDQVKCLKNQTSHLIIQLQSSELGWESFGKFDLELTQDMGFTTDARIYAGKYQNTTYLTSFLSNLSRYTSINKVWITIYNKYSTHQWVTSYMENIAILESTVTATARAFQQGLNKVGIIATRGD